VGHERREGVAIQAIRAVGVECRQVHLLAEVGEQQKTLRQILFQDLRHIEPETVQPAGHRNVALQVFPPRRGIHDDMRGAPGNHPEIAAEARVRRGRPQLVFAQIEHITDPLLEGFEAGIQGGADLHGRAARRKCAPET
jgi:hypothetical protein